MLSIANKPIMPNVVKLCVIMLNAVMLSVIAPPIFVIKAGA
jgi:hypothetical protein